MNSSCLSFLDEEPEGKSRLAIPVIKIDRALSNDPNVLPRRNAVKKSKFAKDVKRLSSRSANENNSLDGVRSDNSKEHKIGSARLGLSSALQVTRKRADSGLSNMSKEEKSCKGLLNISMNNVSTYASTKVSSQATPMSKVETMGSSRHRFESEEDACFSSVAKDLKPD